MFWKKWPTAILKCFKACFKQLFKLLIITAQKIKPNNKMMLNCRENDGRRTTLGAEMESRHISAQWRAKPEPVGGVITAPELFSLGRQRAVTNCLIYRGQRSNTGTTAADRLCFSPFYLMINLPSHALSLAQTQTGTPSLVHPGGLLNVACQEGAKWVFCLRFFWPNCLNLTWPPGCKGW